MHEGRREAEGAVGAPDGPTQHEALARLGGRLGGLQRREADAHQRLELEAHRQRRLPRKRLGAPTRAGVVGHARRLEQPLLALVVLKRPDGDAAHLEQREDGAAVLQLGAGADVDPVEFDRALLVDVVRVAAAELHRIEAALPRQSRRHLDELRPRLDAVVNGVRPDEPRDDRREVARARADVEERVAAAQLERLHGPSVDRRRRKVDDDARRGGAERRVRVALLVVFRALAVRLAIDGDERRLDRRAPQVARPFEALDQLRVSRGALALVTELEEQLEERVRPERVVELLELRVPGGSAGLHCLFLVLVLLVLLFVGLVVLVAGVRWLEDVGQLKEVRLLLGRRQLPDLLGRRAHWERADPG